MAPRVKDEVPEITVKLLSQLNEQDRDQYFRVRCNEPLQQLFIRWAARVNIDDYRTYRFTLDGKRVPENQTPNEIELVDGDCIDAFTEQFGA